jgi:hypothetical protein
MMSKSLADLRANPLVESRPERSLTVCLKPQLVARVQSLTAELETLPAADRVDDDGNRTAPPRRLGEVGEHPRATEIRAELNALADEMEQYEGELTLRATSDGDWRIWANQHPARVEGKPGHLRDVEIAGGYCDADALIDDLGKYVYAWNGDPLAASDWANLFEPNLAMPFKKQAASMVVSMFESRLDFRQWRTGLSADLNRWNDLERSEKPASVPDAGTDGNPAASSEGLTGTETPAR